MGRSPHKNCKVHLDDCISMVEGLTRSDHKPGHCWAEAPIKIARMTLTIKLDRNWSSFQLANSTPPQSVIDNAIAPPARIPILPGAKIYSYLPTATTALYCCFLISVGDRANASRRRQKLCCGQTPEEPPKALQTSECDELLDFARASCLILAQRQPGKFV